jgi:hypothetical protein
MTQAASVSKFVLKKLPAPPKELGPNGRKLWRSLQAEYGIDDSPGLTTLLTVCRSEEDLVRMREQVRKEGDLVANRHGEKVQHPLLAAIRGTETVKRQALRELHLDNGTPPAKIGRPIK